MIDDEDLELTALFAPASWIGLAILIVVAIAWYASRSECEKRVCLEGEHPAVVHSECVCLREAKP
jgi:hypothetical protein